MMMNRIVYAQLSVATSDGTSHHLVKQFDGNRDGHDALKALCEWYDGDLIKNENAKIVRVKLDGLKLYSGISASDYINNFMNLSNELNKIDGEAYSDNHYKFLFLKNIEHPDYQITKKLIKTVKDSGLQDYITAIRKQERELLTEKFEVKKRKMAHLRRKNDLYSSNESDGHIHKIRKLSGQIETTEQGFIHLEASAWKELDPVEKKLVQKYNAKVKHNEIIKMLNFQKEFLLFTKQEGLMRVIFMKKLIAQINRNLQLKR